jgi:hypothetical protein
LFTTNNSCPPILTAVLLFGLGLRELR